MGTVTLLPDLTIAEAGLFTTDGTAVTALAALAGSDASWVRNNGTGNPYRGTYRFQALSLPAGAVVKSVKMQIRYSHAKYLNDYEMIQPETVYVGRPQGGGVDFLTFTSGEHPTLWAEDSVIRVWTGPARVQGYDGDYLGQLLAETSGARLYGRVQTARNFVHNTARIYRFELVVTYNERPTVTVQQPTGSVTISRPPVAWTHTDPDGDRQQVVQVKFFTQAQYTAPGFDPETTATPFSYNLWRTVANLTPTKPIVPNGSWRAYVRTAQVGVSNMEMWSAWAFSGFTLSVVGPAIPAIVAVHDPSVNAIHVTTTGSLPGAQSSYEVHLQRSFDAGATWEDIPDDQTLLTGTSLSFYDYDVGPGVTVHYRAQARSIITASGDPVSSDWSDPVEVTMPAFEDWWLRDLIADPPVSMPLRVLPGFGGEWVKPMTVGYALGDTNATVTHDGVKNGPLGGEVDLLDQDAYETFEQMVWGGNTLVLQDTFGRSWHVQPSDSTKWEPLHAQATASETTTTRHAHRFNVQFIPVEPPSG